MSAFRNSPLLVLTAQRWHSTNTVDWLFIMLLLRDSLSRLLDNISQYWRRYKIHKPRKVWKFQRYARSLYGRHRGVRYVVSRNSLLGTPLRPLLASSISFINGVTCYGRICSRTRTAHIENVTRTHASLRTFIPYGDVRSPWRESPWVRY